jgi:hypothetical protein
MSKTVISKSLKIISIFLVTTLLTSCAAGRTAETRMIKQVTDGVEGQSNEIRVRNLLVIKQVDNTGVLIGTFVNWSEDVDAITSISIDGQPAVISATSLELKKNTPITFVGDIANADASVVQMAKAIGNRVPVEVNFAKASPITFDALIVAADGIYADIENMRFKA